MPLIKPFFPKVFEEGFLFKIDLFFLNRREKFSVHFLDIFFQKLATIDKNYFLMFILYGIIFYFLENKYDIFQFAFLVALSDQFVKHLVKNIFRRFRPYRYLTMRDKGDFHALAKFRGFALYGQKSMCSAHATNFLAQAFLVNHLVPKISIYYFIIFTLIGFGRWFIGAHWASDVIVGWIFGILLFFLHIKYIYPFILFLINFV
jgi:membrane-associated phospholipid phosphatase